MEWMQILTDVILPIFVMIGIGILVDRSFKIDLPTLATLNFYVLVPALLFYLLSRSALHGSDLTRIALFTLGHAIVLFALGFGLFSMKEFKSSRVVMAMSSGFYNCGNYGIPLITLAFSAEAAGILAAVIMIQNLLNYTVGVLVFEKKKKSLARALAGLLKIPIIWAVAAGLAVNYLNLQMPVAVEDPITRMADCLVGMALFTLGVQLSRSLGFHQIFKLSFLSFVRLIISPVLAFFMVGFFGIQGETAQVLIVVSGAPVAVNVYIIAAKYKMDDDLASLAVFWTTLLSAATVTALLLMVDRLQDFIPPILLFAGQ
ncbi:MAG: AEC family transporter [Candidatus Sumerlaeota bacterium]